MPAYRLHKPSGQARVIIDHKHVYLGKYGAAESWEKYNRLIARRLNGQSGAIDSLPCTSCPEAELSFSELILAY